MSLGDERFEGGWKTCGKCSEREQRGRASRTGGLRADSKRGQIGLERGNKGGGRTSLAREGRVDLKGSPRASNRGS